MFSWHKPLSIFLLVAAVALAGCNTAQPTVFVNPTAAPTQDLDVVRTQAAETVVAQITADALANPSETPTLVPTATNLPPTEAPTVALVTMTPVTLATSTPVRASTSSSGTSFYPTNTGTPYTDRATYVTQNLADGITLKPGQDFDMIWTVKNTGARDWTNEFYYKYLSGDLKPKNKLYYTGVVKKGASVDLIADFVAPSTSGRYTSNWAIINDDGVQFFRMYIVINVP